MDIKKMKKIGFKMNVEDDSTILIEGIIRRKVSKKQQKKLESQFSIIYLHTFEKEYIETLQKIKVNIISDSKDSFDVIRDRILQAANLLMK